MPIDNDEFAVRLGARIRDARKRAGLSSRQLATRLGISQPQVAKYESGQDRVAAVRLVEIARVLRLPVAWFYEKPRRKREMAQ